MFSPVIWAIEIEYYLDVQNQTLTDAMNRKTVPGKFAMLVNVSRNYIDFQLMGELN